MCVLVEGELIEVSFPYIWNKKSMVSDLRIRINDRKNVWDCTKIRKSV